jgi:tetratricopeptide (TPR) repeat protein
MKRFCPVFLLFLLTCVLPLRGLVLADETVDELIKQGDVFDKNLQSKQALTVYLQALRLQPDNVPLLLCIARQYRHEAADAGSVETKLKLGRTAKDYAMRALSLAPNDSEAHLSVAISHAKMTPIQSNKERMDASKIVKAEVDKSISLDPSKDLAWHVLGLWHQRLAELGSVKRAAARMLYGKVPNATNEEAALCFETAIKLNPNRLMHYIELGRTYARMGKTAEARKYIEKGLSMPNAEKDDPDAKARGRETLSTLK